MDGRHVDREAARRLGKNLWVSRALVEGSDSRE